MAELRSAEHAACSRVDLGIWPPFDSRRLRTVERWIGQMGQMHAPCGEDRRRAWGRVIAAGTMAAVVLLRPVQLV